MSLSDIVSVTISAETQSVAVASFGTPGIIGEFATSKTTPAFDRARSYASLAEMSAAGWTTSDAVYNAAAKIFSQNPSVDKVLVGRKDASDADFAAALALVAVASSDWYAFVIVGGDADDVKDAAAWAETEKKIFFFGTAESGALDPASTTDLLAWASAQNLSRTVGAYHATATEYLEAAWIGECLPFDPGSQTWAFKNLAGVSADSLTSAQENAVLGKEGNVYITVGGVDVTRNGTTASGEYIDVIRGLDWLESRLQEAVFQNLVQRRKIPFSDAGITMIGGIVEGVLSEAVNAGVLQPGSVVVTLPKYADIPLADKTARNLPDVKFTALLEGAIHSVEIQGVVSL